MMDEGERGSCTHENLDRDRFASETRADGAVAAVTARTARLRRAAAVTLMGRGYWRLMKFRRCSVRQRLDLAGLLMRQRRAEVEMKLP